MAQLIDASVLISLERRGLDTGMLADVVPAGLSAISSITASELLVGAHRAETAERRVRRETFVEGILGRLPVVAFDTAAARTHAEIWAQLLSDGQAVGRHDLIVAATALAHGYAVATENVREFARIPGLVVLEPQWPAGP